MVGAFLPIFVMAEPIDPLSSDQMLAAKQKIQQTAPPLNSPPLISEPISSCSGLSFFGDFLYWKATSEWPFAQTADLFEIPSVIQLGVNGKIEHVRFH